MLPWGRADTGAQLSPGTHAEVKIVPFDAGSSSRTLLSMFRPLPRFSADEHGTTTGAPGSAYQIEITLREPRARAGAMRVVRASIGGVEINEQLVIRAGNERQTVRFVGWLDSPDGTKRIHFTFPTSGETEIQVGIFDATPAAPASSKADIFQAPQAAVGQGFQGPAVSSERFTLGQPVAIGRARLRSDAGAEARS